MRREVLRKSAATLAVRGLATGLTFGMHVLIARLLGAAGTGFFFLSLAITRAAVDVGRFGLHQSVIRFVAPALKQGDAPEAARYVGAGAALVLGLGTAAAAALSAVSAFALPVWAPARADLWELTAVFAWSAVLLALLAYLTGVIEAMARPAAASFLEVGAIPALTATGLLVAAAAGSPTSWTVAWLYMTGAAAALAGAAALVALRLRAPPRVLRREAGILLRASHPLFLVNATGYVLQYAPLLILGAFASLAEVGVFSLVHRVAMAMSILLLAVNSVMRPRFAVAWREGRIDALQRDLDLSGLMLLGVGAPVIAALIALSPQLLGVVGDEFRDGALALTILLAGQLVNMATASSGAVLAMTGNERLLRTNNLVAAVACIVLSAALAPAFGMVGAATALALAMALQSVLAAVQMRRKVGVAVLNRDMFRGWRKGDRE